MRATERPDGPYLAVAALCEYVLREEGGTNSLIRIIDRFTFAQSSAPDQAADDELRGVFTGYLVVSFRSGSFQGAATVSLLGTGPTGEELPRQDIPVFFEGVTKGSNSGVNLVVDLTVGLTGFGEMTFDVLLDDAFITRIPLQVAAALHSEDEVVSHREDSEGAP